MNIHVNERFQTMPSTPGMALPLNTDDKALYASRRRRRVMRLAYKRPENRRPAYRHVFKRMVDMALVVMSAPFILPLIAIFALWVSRDGGQPFYWQERIGQNGRVYRMWKLRTMVEDADRCLEECLKADPEMRAEWDCKQKLMNDPRITRTGQFLRKTSLDELPQLWNVLIGDMSLVGPRPMMVFQKALYPGTDYYELRPGITGLWQISDRNTSSFADRAKFDAVYNQTLSLLVDMRVLFATVRVVLRGTGH